MLPKINLFTVVLAGLEINNNVLYPCCVSGKEKLKLKLIKQSLTTPFDPFNEL